MINEKHPVYDLPQGTLVKGIVIPLKFNCAPGCVCRGNTPRNWHHKCCGFPSFINQYGDIFCKNYQDQDKLECSGYFIKDASFQCKVGERNETWQQGYRNASQFLMTIAQAMQAAEFSLGEDDILTFGTSLTAEVTKRWYQ